MKKIYIDIDKRNLLDLINIVTVEVALTALWAVFQVKLEAISLLSVTKQAFFFIKSNQDSIDAVAMNFPFV